MIEFSRKMTKEFIYEICRPKNVLFIGVDAPKWLGIKYNKENDSVLNPEDNLFLIQKKIIQKIPHYMIYHTSINNSKFNTGKNLIKKMNYFSEIFK